MINLNKKAFGVLCPIFSIFSKYGIGTLGAMSYKFVDYLNSAGYKYGQILPLHPPTIENSPYTAYSAFAGNEYFIDLEKLEHDGYLSKNDCREVEEICKNVQNVFSQDSSLQDSSSQDFSLQDISLQNAFSQNSPSNNKSFGNYISYDIVRKSRNIIFKKLFQNFKRSIPADFANFCKNEKYWLESYAQFMAIHDYFNGVDLVDWPSDYKKYKQDAIDDFCNRHEDEILYYKMLQYFFFDQWSKLKEYANSKGVYIIGDIPYYVSDNSADVGQNPKIFRVDEDLCPLEVAGCPPDMFCEDGQLGGNPVYDGKYLSNHNYEWWIKRLKQSFRFCDILRIDHFRGFESYYSINVDEDNAKCGVGKKGPDYDFFKTMEMKLGKKPIIAEDLGFITKDVHKLLDKCGFPGMKVLQFGFDSRAKPKARMNYQPHNVIPNSVCYIGTHDNDTLKGGIDNASDEDIKVVCKYFNLNNKISNKDKIFDIIMTAMLNSGANTKIICVQDLLHLGTESRINVPADVSDKNGSGQLTDELFEKLQRILLIKKGDENYELRKYEKI